MAEPKLQYAPGVKHSGIRQTHENLAGWALIPALFLIVAMRVRAGFRLLSLSAIFCTGLAIYCGHLVANFHIALPLLGTIGAQGYSESMRDAALLFVGYALLERRRRWKELLAGVPWHGYSTGISHFEWLPIRRDLVYRVVDPAIALISGLCLRKIGFGALGWWVSLCAVCLAIVESHAHEEALQRDLDTLDSILESEIQGAAIDHFSGGSAVKQRSLKETAGVSTGADAGLEAQIAQRRKESAGVRS